MASMEELEKRIGMLEDIEAIKQLKVKYMKACDNNYHTEEIAALFTEDCIWACSWEGAKKECYRGKQELKDYFATSAAATSFPFHYAIAPIIDVDGNSATGQWYLWMLTTSVKLGALFSAGLYEDRYEKIDGKWLCKEMHVTLKFSTRYEEGWVKGQWSGI